MTFSYESRGAMYGPYEPGKKLSVLTGGKYHYVTSEENGVVVDGVYYPPGYEIRLSTTKSIFSLSRRQPAPRIEPSSFFLD